MSDASSDKSAAWRQCPDCGTPVESMGRVGSGNLYTGAMLFEVLASVFAAVISASIIALSAKAVMNWLVAAGVLLAGWGLMKLGRLYREYRCPACERRYTRIQLEMLHGDLPE